MSEETKRHGLDCWCEKCSHARKLIERLKGARMILCPDCGNKRCQRATSHKHACTGSNEPGQPGSSYALTAGELMREGILADIRRIRDECTGLNTPEPDPTGNDSTPIWDLEIEERKLLEAKVDRLERELAERNSYIANYEHATKIEREDGVDNADAEALRALAAWLTGGSCRWVSDIIRTDIGLRVVLLELSRDGQTTLSGTGHTLAAAIMDALGKAKS